MYILHWGTDLFKKIRQNTAICGLTKRENGNLNFWTVNSNHYSVVFIFCYFLCGPHTIIFCFKKLYE
jgi:hypothetical protein